MTTAPATSPLTSPPERCARSSPASNVSRPRWLDPHQWRLWLTGLVGSRYDGLRHFAVVTPGVLMRCGQPHVRDLDEIRRRHGLNTVVCARGGTRHPLRGRWFPRERDFCRQHGVDFVHMPFSDAARPSAVIFEQFLAIMRDASRRPVLVHCEQGFHRTGVLAAVYRVGGEGWTVVEAMQEMDQLGFESHRPKRAALRDSFLQWAAKRAEPLRSACEA